MSSRTTSSLREGPLHIYTVDPPAAPCQSDVPSSKWVRRAQRGRSGRSDYEPQHRHASIVRMVSHYEALYLQRSARGIFQATVAGSLDHRPHKTAEPHLLMVSLR